MRSSLVYIPEWGGWVSVRELSGAERLAVEEHERPVLKLVATSLMGECGKSIFADEDIGLLGSKSASAIWRIYEEAARLNGLDEESTGKAEVGLRRAPQKRFYFRLALQLGMTVGELLARISSRELTEWMAFYALEPWGTEIEDHRFGVVTSTIANVNRDPKKRSKAYEATDFFPPRYPAEAEERSIEEDGARWASFFAPFKK